MRTIYLSFIAILLLLPSCSNDDYRGYSYDQSTIYSESNKTQFTEVIAFISPYIMNNGEKKYIVVDNLENITVSINDKSWTADKSYKVESSLVNNKTLENDYWVTSEKMVYPIVVNVRIQPEVFTTAGEYASLLNNFYTLSPGTYVCHIKSFDIVSDSGTTKNIYMPNTFLPLEVKDNQVSANIGQFEILISQ